MPKSKTNIYVGAEAIKKHKAVLASEIKGKTKSKNPSKKSPKKSS